MINGLRRLCPSYIGLGYKNWCGAARTNDEKGKPKPEDAGDRACMVHDFRLRKSGGPKAREFADRRLHKAWKKFKPKTVYGKMYRFGLLLAFKPKRGTK